MKIGYYDGIHEKNNVSYFLKIHAKKKPDKTAFYFKSIDNTTKHKNITYKELFDNTRCFAGGLAENGIKPKDRVLVVAPMSVELYSSIVALQILGAIPVLIDSYSRKEQLVEIMKNSTPAGVICAEQWFTHFKELIQTVQFRIILDAASEYDENIQNNNLLMLSSLLKSAPLEILPTDKEETALLTYTTGSTGIPKGVDRTHSFLCAQHYALRRLFPYRDDTVDLPVFPVFTLNNLASGISTVIPSIDISKPKQSDAQTLINQINSCVVSTLTLAPSSLKTLAKYCNNNNQKLNTLSRVLTGGAPISSREIAEFSRIAPNSKNWVLYGSTEVEPISYIEAKVMIGCEIPTSLETTKIGVNVGKIDDELDYKFISLDFEPSEKPVYIDEISVDEKDVGELIVSGDNVSKRYYKNENAIKENKIIDKKGNIWHRTGDLARIDEHNMLWIVGRKNNLIRIGPKLYFPVRPEILLKDQEGIINSAYTSITKKGKPVVLAVVVIANKLTAESETIKKSIISNFKKYKIPLNTVVIVEKIPMDLRHHSKVDYKKLKRELLEYVT